MPSHNENLRTRKASNASVESFVDVNSDTSCKKTITKSENASNRQQFHSTREMTINKIALIKDVAETNLNFYNFSFGRIPYSESWFKVFSRQDKCEENVIEYYENYYYHQLPFELGPLVPKTTNCSLCPKRKSILRNKLIASNYLNKSNFRLEKQWKTKRHEKNSHINLEISRRSPREHASTLAIMSCLLQGAEAEYERDMTLNQINLELRNQQIYANNCLRYNDRYVSNIQSNLDNERQVQATTEVLYAQKLDKNILCKDSLRKMEKDIDFQLLHTFKELDSLDNVITLTNQDQHCLFTHDFCLDSPATTNNLICETERRGPGRPRKKHRIPKTQDSIFSQFIENSIKSNPYNRNANAELKANLINRKVTSKLVSERSDNLNAAIQVGKCKQQKTIVSSKYNTRNKSCKHKRSDAIKVKAPTKTKRNLSRFQRIKFKNLDVIQTKGKCKSIPDVIASTSRMATRGMRKSRGYLYKKR